jgi:lipoprotein-anchoring transpeptidase ErfK/SrfK
MMGLGAALVGAILTLASCGTPTPFVHVPQLSQLASFGHRLTAPAAPQGLNVELPNTGAILGPDAWTSASQVRLGAQLPNGSGQGVLEAEFRPEQQPLVGQPNVTGSAGEQSVLSPEMDSGLQYHWALRFRSQGGSASPWARYSGTIGYQATPPPAPEIQALPHDNWSGSRQVNLSWQAEGDPAGIAGFGFAIDQSPAGALPVRTDTTSQSTSFTAPRDGDWFLHVRTIDGAGNASAVATLPFHVDTAEFSVEPPAAKVDGSWNPILGPLPIEAKASKSADMAISIVPDRGTVPVRTFKVQDKADATVQWDGKDDSGKPVGPGNYRVRVDATDKTGRTAQALAKNQLPVTNKRIVVSLAQERMVAFEGDKPFVDTLVTTGGPELPTPVGTFHILEKRSPFTFKSPWPKSSPYWYADSPTSYAMLFEDSGYFIHDSPWRSWYGPGSNATDGKPGGDGTGTHGCVNVPLGVQAKLYTWTDLGTPVIVINGPIS